MKGKYQNNSGKKSLALMLALMMLLGCLVGGTIAWLTVNTDPVTNTFVAGQIGTLTLTESDTDTNTAGTQHEYLVIPGTTITKNPTVNYNPDTKANVAAYVFVKIENANNATWAYNAAENQYEIKSGSDVMLSFKVDSSWTPVEGASGVFYQAVAVGAELEDVEVIAGNSITVSDDITAQNIAAITDNADALKFTAYAIQQDGFDSPAGAWAELNPTN